ncbi:hypothetical protein PYCCODRAFT_1451328 [Trametes coccinea BRFM310]|uniref:Calcineurin-like phosphoesterase domain-containing protein n=1 Tax=Trametes coccinea (strain BRFM310) TaxID=1353009 RepID=A0A1Y2IVM2_TRAC3|nr:hypothetical protein PYCCODRAFT_1451328 [Trametes coccinea BRFM310]
MLTASRRSLLRRTRDLLFARWGLLDWLRLLWCSLVCWHEFASFHYALTSCTWPDGALPASPDKPAHVLLVADPQVRDLSTSRRIGFSALRRYVLDLTLKRHWHFASRTHPDVVIFLGDILASWRLTRTDEEYERNLRKFRDIFHLDPGVTSYYVPGNNDVGLNIEPSAAREARNRFTTHFGPLNQRVVLRNHTLVMLDAAGLVEEDYLRAAKYIDYEHWKPLPHGTVEFVHSLQNEFQAHPMVLFTHIPLHRPDTASCGPLREKGTIHRGVGPGYQNTLGKKTTTFLLQTLRPNMVYSADDKDYCDYVHIPPKSYGVDASTDANAHTVREVTLKAFSPSSDIRHPGFQLLTLASPAGAGTRALADTPCFFPDYPSVYSWRYIPLFFLTMVVLVILRLRKSRVLPLPLHARRGGFRKTFSIHTLPPDAPWLLGPHPPTPFSPDWCPRTPGFISPHASRSPRPSCSPTDELPRSLRTPVPVLGEGKGGDADYIRSTPSTPTFRATTHVREASDNMLGPAPFSPRLVVFDAREDGEHDEFAHGRHDPRRLSRAERGADGDADVDPAGMLSNLGFTFTLGGQRRRVSFGSLLPRSWATRAGLPDAPVGFGKAGGKRAFALRVFMDLVYIAWPAVLVWVLCAWRLK